MSDVNARWGDRKQVCKEFIPVSLPTLIRYERTMPPGIVHRYTERGRVFYDLDRLKVWIDSGGLSSRSHDEMG